MQSFLIKHLALTSPTISPCGFICYITSFRINLFCLFSSMLSELLLYTNAVSNIIFNSLLVVSAVHFHAQQSPAT